MKMKKNFIQVISIYVLLALFGWVYNYVIAWLEDRGYDDGFTADYVSIGVLATLLLLSPLTGAKTFLISLGGFVASGFPMWLGSALRYAQRRERENCL